MVSVDMARGWRYGRQSTRHVCLMMVCPHDCVFNDGMSGDVDVDQVMENCLRSWL